MKFTHLFLVLFTASVFVAGCAKKTDQSGEMKDTVAMSTPSPKDSLKAQIEQWKAFKADANMKIQALQDSVDAYDARMMKANPHYKADMKLRQAIKARATALKTQMSEEKDEAVGSFGRMRDAIVGGLDTLATGVANIVSPSKKK